MSCIIIVITNHKYRSNVRNAPHQSRSRSDCGFDGDSYTLNVAATELHSTRAKARAKTRLPDGSEALRCCLYYCRSSPHFSVSVFKCTCGTRIVSVGSPTTKRDDIDVYYVHVLVHFAYCATQTRK